MVMRPLHQGCPAIHSAVSALSLISLLKLSGSTVSRPSYRE
jgi:hypothetical protein